MTAQIIDGRVLAAKVKTRLLQDIKTLKKNHNIVPGLAIVRVGHHMPSQIYVASKSRQCEGIGILPFTHHLDEDTPLETILSLILRLNEDPQVHGIIVQLPLPKHIDPFDVIKNIDPYKDVDGLHPENQGYLMMGAPRFIPCTPLGCVEILKSIKYPVKGAHAVVVGCSNLVGKPLSMMLLNMDATVTIIHRQTRNPDEICRQADILIVAAGHAHLVQKSWIKPGAVILDVGINHRVDAKGGPSILGDVSFEEALSIASYITPVPGGVGPVTVAYLLSNTVASAKAFAERHKPL